MSYVVAPVLWELVIHVEEEISIMLQKREEAL